MRGAAWTVSTFVFVRVSIGLGHFGLACAPFNFWCWLDRPFRPPTPEPDLNLRSFIVWFCITEFLFTSRLRGLPDEVSKKPKKKSGVIPDRKKGSVLVLSRWIKLARTRLPNW